MTHHINLIAGNKHRQLARQVGVVFEIISTGLMAPINFSAITFIPSMEFTFGSFSFIAGVDGRLHVSDLEATSICQINPDPSDHVVTRSVPKLDSDRLRDRLVLPRYSFGLPNLANTFQRMLNQIMKIKAEHDEDTGKHGRT